ncbi:MAG TPA: S9 family peptidase, partial [Edaphobacter sp.]|nr:S9 family peptidase [Edaphobacter sp.]
MASISPDGKMVAWSVRKGETYEIHLSGVSDSSKDVIIRPAEGGSACSSDAPVWSPDGRSLAYASDCTAEGSRQPQIFVWSKQMGASQQITHVTGTIDDIAWSPDGKQIGFLFVENATRAAGALDAMKPWSGVIGEDGVEVQRIAIANLSDKSVQQVTPENLHIYEYSWAPDSKELAYVAAN